MHLFRGRKLKIALSAFVLSSAFLLFANISSVWAYHATSSYNKAYNDTLTSQNWNDLFSDFVNTWLPVSLNGPVGIGAAAPAAGLLVNGQINATNLYTTGKVGIGTASPGAKLDIRPSGTWSSTSGILSDFSSDNPIIKMYRPTGDGSTAFPWYVETFANGNLEFLTGNAAVIGNESVSPKITIKLNGKVGIGTTTPSTKLDIDGGTGNVLDVSNGRIVGLNSTPISDNEAVPLKYLQDNYAPIGTGAGSAFVQGGNSFGATATLGTNDNYPLNIKTNNATRMTVLANGNVGIGTTTPMVKLDVNGDIKASGSLQWGGGGSIANSDIVSTFPYDEMMQTPFNGNKVLVRFVNSRSTATNPDGLSWDTAYKEIQDAVNSLPHSLNNNDVLFFIQSGTYQPTIIWNSHGTIEFHWVGTFVNNYNGTKNEWLRSMSSTPNPVTDNEQIKIISHDTTPPFRVYGEELTFKMFATNEDIQWNQPGAWYFGRWYFSTTSNPPYLFDANFWDGKGSLVIDTGIVLDMKNTGQWWGYGIGIGTDKPSFIRAIQVIGGDGDASTNTSPWAGAIAMVRSTSQLDLCTNVGAQWASGYEPPDGKLGTFSDIRNVYTSFYRDESGTKTIHLGSDTQYKNINYSYGKGNIQLTSKAYGYYEYTPTYYYLIDTSTYPHTIRNADTARQVQYVVANGGTLNGNIVMGTSAKNPNYSPTDDYGVFISNDMADALYVENTDANTHYRTFIDNEFNLIADTGNGEDTILSADGSKLQMYNGNLTINTNGKIGIGTTTPSTKLDIDGGTGNVLDVSNGRIVGLNSTPISDNEAVPLKYLQDNYAPIGTGAGSAFVQGGNSFGATATLGTNDNYPLNIKTNNAIRMTVLANGNVGIGTSSPISALHVVTNSVAQNGFPNTVFINNQRGDYTGFMYRADNGSGNYQKAVIFNDNRVSTTGVVYPFFNIYRTGASNSGDIMRVSHNSGSSDFLVDHLGNVGMGATTPNAKLEIQTTGAALRLSYSPTKYTTFTMGGDGAVGVSVNNHTKFYIGDSPLTGIEVPSNYSIAFVNPGVAVLSNLKWDNTNKLFKFRNGADNNNADASLGSLMATGKIGIGTTTPSTKLDIDGGTGNVLYVSNGRIVGLNSTPISDNEAVPLKYLQDNYAPIGTGAGSAFVQGGNSFGTTATLGTNDNYPLNIKTNNATRMTVLANGNVGIGTSNPGHKLEIAGTSKFTDTMDISASKWIRFGNSGPGGNPGGFQWLMTNDGASMYVSEVSSDQTDYVFKLWDNTTNDRYVWWIDDYRGTSYDKYPLIMAGNYANFFQGRLYINDDTGNVGIGATNPGAKLEINVPISSSSGSPAGLILNNIYGTNNSGTIRMMPYEDKSGGFISFGAVPTLSGYQISNIVAEYGAGRGGSAIESVNGNVYFHSAIGSTYNGVSMSILNSGNVGISTTTPSTKLNIDGGTGNVLDVSGGRIIGLNTTPVGSTEAVPLSYLQANYSPSSNSLWNGTLNGNIYNGTNGSGNVGIGTTSPSEKLDVSGKLKVRSNANAITIYNPYSGSSDTSYTAYLVGRDNTNSDVWYVGDGGGQKVIGLYASDSSYDLGLYNGGNYSLYIKSNGKVGIGTTAPDHQLEVHGSGSGAGLRISDTTSGYGVDITGQPSGGLISVRNSAGTSVINIDAQTNANSFFNTGGNVGIGTTNPTVKLDVNGGTGQVLDVSGGRIIGLNTTPVSGSEAVPLSYLQANYAPIGTGAGSAFVQGGNSFGATATLGTNDNYPLNIKTNNATRMTVLANGNVGIGTDSPKRKLHVYGSGTLWTKFEGNGYNVMEFNSGVGTGYFGVENTSGGQIFTSSLAGATVLGSKTSDALQFGTGQDIKMTIAPSGNVGIGTTSPTEKLDVNGNIVVQDGNEVYLSGAGTRKPVRLYTYPDAQKGVVDIERDGVVGVHLNPNGDSYINSIIGNVGIGTTNPGAKLHIKTTSGEISAKVESDDGNAYYIVDNGSTNKNSGIRFLSSGSYKWFTGLKYNHNDDFTIYEEDGSDTSRFVIKASTGKIGIGTTTPSTKLDIDGGTGNVLDVSGGRIIGLNTTPVSGNEAVPLSYLQANYSPSSNSLWNGTLNGNIYNGTNGSGNVGIGTTNPGAKLEVGGNIKFGANNSNLLAGNANYIYIGQTNSGTENPETSSGYFFGINPRMGTDRLLAIEARTNDGAGAITFNTYSGIGTGRAPERMRITSNGNVGIGTTNPSQKLDVNGTAVFGTTIKTTLNGGDIIMNRNSANYFSTSNSTGYFAFRTGGYVNRMIIGATGDFNFNSGQMFIKQSTGRVGVGTTNPNANFEVYNSSLPSIRISSAGTYGSWGLETDSDVSFDFWDRINNKKRIKIIANGSMGFGNNITAGGGVSGSDLVIDNTSKIGIGTTTPSTKLDIDGNTTGQVLDVSGGRIIGLNTTPVLDNEAVPLKYLQDNYAPIGTGAGSAFVQGGNSFGTTATLGTNDNYPLNIKTNNATRMTVLANGNVGIGTTNPGSFKLKVAGDVGITGTLSTQTGADFAEEFATVNKIEPGTVVVLGNQGYKSVKVSTKEYDPQVIGVVSDNPSIISGKIKQINGNKVIVAMVGVVSVKVTSANGPITRGDLLTSSSLAGYAMRADKKRSGTIIGKALEDLVGERGVIKVLVNLQ